VPVLLFIDEAHTIIGAGNQLGDRCGNLLKPALARGELRTIAPPPGVNMPIFERAPSGAPLPDGQG
jgi:hypothetical protein